MRFTIKLLLWLVVTIAITEGQLFAQATDARISGVVEDESGAVIPGATVVATNVETGLTRTASTDDRGNYVLRALPPGQYDVRAELTGFNTLIRSGLQLHSGGEVAINLVLQVGEITQSVVVTGEAPLVSTTTSDVGGLVNTDQINNLPLNGRDLTHLALMEAGVVLISNTRKDVGKGFGPVVSMGGARPDQTGYLLDGTDIKSIENFQAPQSVAGVTLGVDTVREFKVLVNNYSAEYGGRAAGGVISAVTKSGTNQLHGTAFEFHRNDNLDARNFFDPGEGPPEFKRNQFGFTAGGPVVRDQTFFFGSFEGVRERLAFTNIYRVPTQAARQGNLANGKTVEVSEKIVPYLGLYPLPNGEIFGDVGEYIAPFSQPTDESYFMAKVDHSFSDDHNIYARYTFDDSTRLGVESTGAQLPNFPQELASRSQYTTVEDTYILSPRVLNQLRLSYNRTAVISADIDAIGVDPSLFFVPGVFGQFQLGGGFISNPGVNGKNPRTSFLNLFQFANTVSVTQGRHNLKFGASVSRFQFNTNSPSRFGGEWRFTSMKNLLLAKPNRLRISDPSSDTIRGFRQWMPGFFIQDDFRMTRRLTLNLGLRYEFITVPTEVNGKIANLRDIINDTEVTVGDPFFKNPSLKLFVPRVGLAFDPTGSGKTVIRGGFGIFPDHLLPTYYRSAGTRQPPFFFQAQVKNPKFPDALSNLKGSSSSLETNQFEAEQPYLMQWNLGIQQQLLPNTMFSVHYIGSRSVHMQREHDDNQALPDVLSDGRLFFPDDGRGRRNPKFKKIHYYAQDGNSFYHGAQFRFRKSMSSGLQFQLSYSLSKSIDEGSVAFGATDYGYRGTISNVYDRKAERGLSNFDIRHNFTVNYSYELPWGASLSGVGRALAHGWQVAGIVQLASGTPFPLRLAFDRARSESGDLTQKPDLLAGGNSNPVSGVTAGCDGVPAGQKLGGRDLYFDPCQFVLPEAGFFGNLGRNTIIGPGLANVDFSLMKNFGMGETRRLQFRTEFFNIFNHTNFASPPRGNLDIFDKSGRIQGAGRLTSTVTAPRQIQFGLKFIF
ncbi:MAG: TonB-dependent receptor [Acidobacteria bacterium]|nr:TonB-dependent receptor [Acidobacteriota bacterium]